MTSFRKIEDKKRGRCVQLLEKTAPRALRIKYKENRQRDKVNGKKELNKLLGM